MQEMSEIPDEIDLDNQKHVEMVIQEFQRMITKEEQEVETFRQLKNSADQIRAPTLKQFYILVTLMYIKHAETLELFKNYFLGIVELNKELREKTEKLEKEIQYISKNTDVDLSEIKTQVAKIKEAVEAPIYEYVKRQQDTDAKRKKLEDELLDWAIRSR